VGGVAHKVERHEQKQEEKQHRRDAAQRTVQGCSGHVYQSLAERHRDDT